MHDDKIKELESRLRALEDRALVKDTKEKQTADRWNFIFRNWRVLAAATLLLLGVYEGAKYLLYLQPPVK